MRKDNSVFKTKFISEPGSFLQNADYFAFVELQDYACYCIADDTDDIVDTEVKFFVFAANDQWGFYLLPIAREGNQLYLGREEFFAFENDVWEVDFFDGTK